MFYELGFLYPLWALILSILLGLAIWYKIVWYKPVYYKYPLTSFLAKEHGTSSKMPLRIPNSLRCLLLLVLILLSAGLRKADKNTLITTEGIDIMLLVDVSGSMQAFDDLQNPIPRIESAKKEAINFIAKRTNDQIGLVLFGKHAISRCPLTIDKNIVTTILKDLSLGVIDPSDTVIAQALLLGANRLKDSGSTSKVMILLTDGCSGPEDIALEQVMPLIKKLNIKVYTIGIGNQEQAYIPHPLVGIMPVQILFNQELLKAIAQTTGGEAFLARNPDELAKVYTTIDALEKTQRDVPLYTTYHDFFKLLTLGALILLLVEWLLRTVVWFIV